MGIDCAALRLIGPRSGNGTSDPPASRTTGHRAGFRFLALDAHGRALDWIGWQEAACLYARAAVAWTLGESCLTVRGGVSRMTGQRSEDVLYGPQRISIGGLSSVRGFKEQSLSGDSGGYWRNQLRWRRPVTWEALRPFVHEYGTNRNFTGIKSILSLNQSLLHIIFICHNIMLLKQCQKAKDI